MADRDSNGRLLPGHTVSKGKGRPKKAREEKYYEIAMSAVSYVDWKKIIKKAAQQAVKGDSTARKFLADYLVGPPQQRLDLTTGGEQLPGAIIYLPEVDGLEAKSGTAGEVSSEPGV